MVRALVVFLLALVLTGAAWVAPASAQPEGGDDEATPSDVEEEADESIDQVTGLLRAEPVVYQITFPKFHAIVTPAFMLDAFFAHHPNHWSDGQQNWAIGGEFIIRRIDDFDLVFSLDWADIRTQPDWWLENDEDIIDADWGENELSLLTADVAINWMTKITENWDFYYGVGLGIALVLGDFVKQDVSEQCLRDQGVNPFDSEDIRFVEACERGNGTPILDPNSPIEEEDRVPPLLPALTLTAGSRWIIDEDWAVQVELGYKNIYLYAGLELGYIFK